MARVPQYQQQVAPTVTPFVRRSDNNANAEDFGGGLAQVAGKVAGLAQTIAQNEQEKYDTAKLMQAQRAMSDLDAGLLNDPEKGAFATQGEQAIGIDKKVLPDWDREASAIADSLPNHLRGKFQSYVASRRERAASQLMSHSLGEAEKFYTANENATIKAFADEALRNSGDPEAVDNAIASGWQVIDAQMRRQGMPGKAAEQARAEYASGIYRSAIEGQVGNDPLAADARFQEVRSRLTGPDAAAIEDKLRPLLRANEFEAIAEVAVAGGAPSVNVVPPQRGQPSPEVRSAIESAAAKYGVPVEYLLALCEQESSFNPKAVNKESGAAGLFQYIPATAQDRGIDPMDIQAACDAAARDFAERMKAGGPQEAMASHFAGPGGGNRGEKTAAYVAEVTGRAMRWGGQANRNAPTAAPVTLGEALGTIKDDPRYANPVWRRGAEAAIERKWSVKERDEADRDRVLLDSMRERVEAAPIGASLSATLGGDYSTAATKGWLGSLESIAKAKAEGRLIQTNPITYDKFARLLATNPAEFAKPQTMRDIGAAAGELATSDYDRLRGEWASLQKPDAKPNADWASEQDRIDAGLRLLGLEAVRGNPKVNEAERGQFRLFYQQAEAAFIQSQGKKPTPEQADALLREVVTRVARNPGLLKGASAAERFALGGEVQGASGPVKLSEHDRQTVVAVLRMRGNPNPTEAQIVAAAGAYYASP